jgi:ribosomal protein S18
MKSLIITEENEKYINWKSPVFLNEYISRFADIKARKYTKNSVKIQKKLRKAIIRARELGLLPYVK